jgi:hypothetical protein
MRDEFSEQQYPCPRCGRAVERFFLFCPHCESPLGDGRPVRPIGVWRIVLASIAGLYLGVLVLWLTVETESRRDPVFLVFIWALVCVFVLAPAVIAVALACFGNKREPWPRRVVRAFVVVMSMVGLFVACLFLCAGAGFLLERFLGVLLLVVWPTS